MLIFRILKIIQFLFIIITNQPRKNVIVTKEKKYQTNSHPHLNINWQQSGHR